MMRKPPDLSELRKLNPNYLDDETDLLDSEFERLADQFSSEPCLENYLKIRDRFHSADVVNDEFSESIIHSELWEGFSQGRAKFGLSVVTILNVVNGEQDALDSLCLALGRAWVERKSAEADEKTHQPGRGFVISDYLLNTILSIALESAAIHKLTVPPSLAALFREVYLGRNAVLSRSLNSQYRKVKVLWAAKEMKASNETVSIRSVAKKVGLNPTSVMRMFGGEDNFHKEIRDFQTRLAPRQ